MHIHTAVYIYICFVNVYLLHTHAVIQDILSSLSYHIYMLYICLVNIGFCLFVCVPFYSAAEFFVFAWSLHLLHTQVYPSLLSYIQVVTVCVFVCVCVSLSLSQSVFHCVHIHLLMYVSPQGVPASLCLVYVLSLCIYASLPCLSVLQVLV
eukprot:GHVQ01026500.1.p1 GENE.GHVQ01026500.1~~GHVQ01026500.1.p1  ORF type:complete len:151 (+),score=27.29 GHVQ01026500.1:284-736(+)